MGLRLKTAATVTTIFSALLGAIYLLFSEVILGEFATLEAAVAQAYDTYEFHVVYQLISQFCAVQLSAMYHDVVKDRLYTDPAGSDRRRSTQSALHRILTRLTQALAPILAFTADEAWEQIPGVATKSVHLSLWNPSTGAAPTEPARADPGRTGRDERDEKRVRRIRTRVVLLPHVFGGRET